MKILFMGTPDFAAAVLGALCDAGMEVTGCVSQPDKQKGRGHKVVPTDTKIEAEKRGIKVYQPEKIKNGEMLPVLEEIKPDVIVVAAYGKILPKYILDYPKYGCVNVHASLLPKYRGAAPIQWAIINGEKVTGVTTMLMGEGLDTGDMLLKSETEIGEYETAEELFDRLAKLGGSLIVKTLNELEKGNITPQKQNEDESTYAPMISRETGIIDWTKTAGEISKLICGMNSWPLASTTYKGERLKIAEAQIINEDSGEEAGKILSLDKGKGLKVACGEGMIYIKVAQFPNSKKMNIEDYARGHEIEIGSVLGKEL